MDLLVLRDRGVLATKRDLAVAGPSEVQILARRKERAHTTARSDHGENNSRKPTMTEWAQIRRPTPEGSGVLAANSMKQAR